MTLRLDRKPVWVMGIVNVTPDSFSDGGKYFQTHAAIEHAVRLIEEGADILDVGGESTRPGAQAVSAAQEQDRILPVIEGIRGLGVPVSVDTRNASTMRAAIAAGASMINDITALGGDPASMEAAASFDGPVCLMHMQGGPQTMQENPAYDDVVADVGAYLASRVAACEAAGIQRSRLVIDPGIGFGKTLEHNIALLQATGSFAQTGLPVLVGASRKRFIAAIDRDALTFERLGGSLAAVLSTFRRGARIFRVHDVAATRQALAVYGALENISVK